ncbi:MAG: alpha/beta fold hydrolase [Steroidobacteraceae bacterium]
MVPLFFGDKDAPLYGVYQPPKGESRNAGVVLCYPFGQEYMRAHRAFRQLALLLTRKGFHVLRFDYRGTGDSSGELESSRIEQWLDDIGHAVQELRDTADLKSVNVVGLRLGALVAAAACAKRDDIDRLILWDPVLTGSAYENELLAEIRNERPGHDDVPSGNAVDTDGRLHYNGFTMAPAFLDGMRRLDLQRLEFPEGLQILQIVSHETEDFAALRDRLRPRAGFRYQFTPAPHDWNYVDNFGGILLPQPVIQAIVNRLDAEVQA